MVLRISESDGLNQNKRVLERSKNAWMIKFIRDKATKREVKKLFGMQSLKCMSNLTNDWLQKMENVSCVEYHG